MFEGSQAAVDLEIAALEEKIRYLLGYRNTLAPISKLPPELLLHVFAQVRDDNLCSGFFGARANTWFAVAEVCASWRKIALSHPMLWSTLCLIRPRNIGVSMNRVELCLNRSRGVPLSTWLRDIPEAYVQDPLFDQLYRTKVLRLINSRSIGDHLSETLKKPAPVLETLELIDDYNPEPFPISAGNMFSLTAPCLKNVAIWPAAIGWWIKAPNRPKFEHLQLGFSSFVPSDIFNMLNDMPNLRSLSLHFIGMNNRILTILPSSPFEPVLLKRLTALTIESTTAEANVLLSSLVLPNIEGVRLILEDITHMDATTIRSFASTLVDFRRRICLPLFSPRRIIIGDYKIEAERRDAKQMIISISVGQHPITRSRRNAAARLAVWYYRTAPIVLHALDLTETSEFELNSNFSDSVIIGDGHEVVPDHAWGTIASQFVALESFTIRFASMPIPLIAEDIEHEDTLYQALKSVKIYTESLQRSSSHLRGWLRTRQQSGVQVQKLIIVGKESNVSDPNYVAPFKNVVKEVLAM